jgi:8-oxo-dGTP diphosphatase
MPDRHENFDAEKLFERKRHHCGYRFCPLCSRLLVEVELDGHDRLTCPDEACGFVFYQNPVPAAGAIIVNEDKVLMVKRGHPPRVGWWCLPAGFMEWDEHPTQTAVRELAEETGLQVRLDEFFEVYSGFDDPRSNAILLLYRATVIGGELQAGDDALEVRYFSFDDLPKDIAFVSHHKALADYDRRYRRGK